MSHQGPIIVVSTVPRPSFASALDDAKMFPVIETAWADASGAVEQLQPAAGTTPGNTDPADDATVLLIGRGAAYPSLSVSLGERMGVVGALSIEAAAKHLSSRDIDGIVLGEGFSARVVDAFLTVLAEDTRFRNLPVVLTTNELAPAYDLPNLEIICGEPEHIAANAL